LKVGVAVVADEQAVTGRLVVVLGVLGVAGFVPLAAEDDAAPASS